MSALETMPGWLARLSTRRPRAAVPAAGDIADAPDVTAEVAAIAARVRPLLTADRWTPDPPPFTGSATVAPMPDWQAGHPFGMARWKR